MASDKTIKKEKTSPLSIGYFGGTDVLRFLCATGVIFHHATLMMAQKGVVTKAEQIHRFSGAFFLDVFFIISGFLISLILMKEFEKGTFSMKNFYLRRVIRIWPLYFLLVVLKIILVPILQGTSGNVIGSNLLYAATFTINYQLLIQKAADTFTILWSICIEEHIYLLLPFLLFLFKSKFRPLAFLLMVTGIASWFYFKDVPSTSGYSTPYFVSTSYFYYFGIGMLIACIKNGNLPGKNLEKTVFKPIIQIVVLLVFFGFVFNKWGDHNSLATILLIYGLFGGYLVWASTLDNFILKLPKFSKYLGNISYAMYVTHIIAVSASIALFKKQGFQFNEITWGWILPIAATLFCMGISSLLYYYFERPILRLKKKYTTVENK